LADEPFIIQADQQQLEQAIINVLKNSTEAIDRDGEIGFTSDTATGDLSITDNGRGIAEQHREQLFTPFFSTKRDGQGIGLTLVKEILLNHGFDFSLKTTSPGCTSFTFHFGK
jgi:two-component system, NtrC family, nitrogen regulation sensor histidine kinase NtrY